MTQKETIVKMLMLRPFRRISQNDLKRYGVEHFIGCIDRRMREICELSNLAEFGLPDLWVHSRPMTSNEMLIYGCQTRVNIYEVLSTDNPLHEVKI